MSTSRRVFFGLLLGSTLIIATPVSPALAVLPTGGCALPALTGSTLKEGKTNYSYFRRPTGTMKAIMIFVEFPDALANDAGLTDTSDYADLLTPAAQWFSTSSYGKFTLDIDTVDQWFLMPDDSTTYGWEDGVTYNEHKAYITDAINAANATVDFTGYKLFYIVPPDNADAIWFSPAYIGGPDGVTADGNKLGFGATFGQDIWNVGWGSRVMNHETGHTFGLPDLYAFDYDDTDYWDGQRFVGMWDLMSYVGGTGSDYLAWHKWKLGWLNKKQIICRNTIGTTTQTLTPVEAGAGKKLLVMRTGKKTAIAVEVRAKVGNDSGMCSVGLPGVLIYRVNAGTETGYGPLQVVSQDTEIPGNYNSCGGPRYNAAFQVGEQFTDATAGVTIKVLSKTGNNFSVQVQRTKAYP